MAMSDLVIIISACILRAHIDVLRTEKALGTKWRPMKDMIEDILD
jgi:hypothetical protein